MSNWQIGNHVVVDGHLYEIMTLTPTKAGLRSMSFRRDSVPIYAPLEALQDAQKMWCPKCASYTTVEAQMALPEPGEWLHIGCPVIEAEHRAEIKAASIARATAAEEKRRKKMADKLHLADKLHPFVSRRPFAAGDYAYVKVRVIGADQIQGSPCLCIEGRGPYGMGLSREAIIFATEALPDTAAALTNEGLQTIAAEIEKEIQRRRENNTWEDPQ